jgi:hypothetical protein
MKTYTIEGKPVSKETVMQVAVGQRVAELLNLKFSTIGRTRTSWGTKSIQGLGACITRIMEEEQIRLADLPEEKKQEHFDSIEDNHFTNNDFADTREAYLSTLSPIERYEREITDLLIEVMEITNGDAQGIVEAQGDIVAECLQLLSPDKNYNL